MIIAGLDHLVLTVADVDASATWYRGVLGMHIVTFGDERTALQFGIQKINLHPASHPIAPHAAAPTRGSGDLCFLTPVPLSEVQAHLAANNILVEEGPVARTGATGPLQSVYIRDPDGNLIEISNTVASSTQPATDNGS